MINSSKQKFNGLLFLVFLEFKEFQNLGLQIGEGFENPNKVFFVLVEFLSSFNRIINLE